MFRRVVTFIRQAHSIAVLAPTFVRLCGRHKKSFLVRILPQLRDDTAHERHIRAHGTNGTGLAVSRDSLLRLARALRPPDRPSKARKNIC